MTGPFLRERGKDLGCALLLAALCVLFERRLLGLDQVMAGYDYLHFLYPMSHWEHLRLAAGQGTFWDQASGLGNPAFDLDLTPWLYLPLRWTVAALDAVPAVAAALVLHHAIAALGAYVLARVAGASAPASFVAAVAVAFAGGMIHSEGSFGLLAALAWFPWMLAGLALIHRAEGPLAPRALAGSALLGAAAGQSLLAGHLGMGVCEAYALAAMHLAFVLAGPGRLGRLKATSPAAAAALLIAALVFGGQAQGLARAAAQNGRGEAFTPAQAAEGSLVPPSLAQEFLPHLLGQPRDNTFLGLSWRFGSYDPQGVILYCGVLAFVLAFVYLAGVRPAEVLPWAAAWAWLNTYALGSWNPAFGSLFYRLPLLDHLHWPLRAAAAAGVLLCVPVALGLDRARLQRPAWPWRLAAALGACLLLAALALKAADPWLQARGRAYVVSRIVGTALHPYPAAFYADKLSRWLTALRAHLACQGAWALAAGLGLAALARARGARTASLIMLGLGLLLYAELDTNLAGYLPVLPRSILDAPVSVAKIRSLEGPGAPPFRVLEWGEAQQVRRSFPAGRFYGDLDGERRAAALVEPATQLLYGLDFVNAYPLSHPHRLESVTGFFRDLTMDPAQPAADLLAHRRLYDLCGARYFLLAEPLRAPGLTPLLQDPVYLYRNEHALPLAWMASDFSDGWDSASAAAALSDPASPQSRWRRPALVEGPGTGSGRGAGSVDWVRHDDEEWDLDADSRGPGVLVLSRSFYPGPWAADVDGQPRPLLPANGALCALALESGRHRVRLRYQDPLPARGMALQALGLGAAAALLAAAFALSRRG